MKDLGDKSQIIERIKKHYGFNTNNQLAAYLGVSPNTISGWIRRNTIDYDLIFSKCQDMSLDMLIWGFAEKHEDTSKEEITDHFEFSDIDDDENHIFKALKNSNGRKALFEYLCKQTNYQNEVIISDTIRTYINGIIYFTKEYNLGCQFDRIYNKLKAGEISKNNMIEIFQNLISKDRVFRKIFAPYIREIMAIDNLIYRQGKGDETPDLSLFEL